MTVSLRDPFKLGNVEVPNRFYRAPVLEGAGTAEDPVAVYAKHFVPNAKAGLGLIVQGNTIVLPEGRTSPGMSAIKEREQMHAFKAMTDGVHEAGGKIVTQLGHGGCFALESWHTTFKRERTQKPMAPSQLPWWIKAVHSGVYIPNTKEVEELTKRFGLVALWAREAGYDGVQLAGSNAKLLHQFMSPIYNKRTDKYGGSVENRFRFIKEIREQIAKQAGEDYPVLLKYSAREESPLGKGISIADGISYAKMAEQCGFSALTPVIGNAIPNTALCRGSFPGHSFKNPNLRKKMQEAAGNSFQFYTIALSMWWASKKYGFKSNWNSPVYSEIKNNVSIPVFAVGGIRTPDEANGILARGEADVIGVGRPFYTEPDLAARFLNYDSENGPFLKVACENSNHCIVPQMLGMPGVCYNSQANQKKREIERGAQL